MNKSCFERRAAGMGFHRQYESQQSFAGKRFCKRKNLQNRKTKPANALVTAEPTSHPGQEKRSSALERFYFLSLLGKGNTTSQPKKKSPRRIIFKFLHLDCKCNAYVYKSKGTKKISKNLA